MKPVGVLRDQFILTLSQSFSKFIQFKVTGLLKLPSATKPNWMLQCQGRTTFVFLCCSLMELQ